MKIFITGGTGFIGQPLVRKLIKNGHNLLLLSRQPIEQTPFSNLKEKLNFINGNLSYINEWVDRVNDFHPDVAIHLAWEGIPDYGIETSINNLNYGLNLFAELVKSGCKKIVCSGSCWEYGLKHGCLNEDAGIKPHNAFTAAKNSLHWLGKEIAEKNEVAFIWTRIFYAYGTGQKDNSLIPYIINCATQGKNPEIKTPYAKNDFVYVQDVADALCMIMDKCNQSAVYNIGSGKSTQIMDIIELVFNMLNVRYKREAISSKSDNKSFDDFWADISKIRNEIGWEPRVSVKEGIQRTVSYYQQ